MPASKNRARCANCGRPIFRNSPGGDWYHYSTISVACRPGYSRQRATPIEVEV